MTHDDHHTLRAILLLFYNLPWIFLALHLLSSAHRHHKRQIGLQLLAIWFLAASVLAFPAIYRHMFDQGMRYATGPMNVLLFGAGVIGWTTYLWIKYRGINE